MSNLRLFTTVLAAATIFFSCAREEKNPGAGPEPGKGIVYTLEATIAENAEGPDGENAVRTSVASDGTVSWKAGDQIAVWDENEGRFCTFTSKSGDGTFRFEGEEGVEYSFTRAVYPVSMAKDNGTVTLPATYTPEEAQSGSLYPMTATVEDGHLAFKQLGALLRYTMAGIPADATALVLSSPEASLSGDFEIVSPEANPEEIRAAAGEGAVTIPLTPGGRKNFTLYFPLPVGSYSCLLSIKKGDEVVETQTTPSVKDVLRHKMLQMNLLLYEFEYGDGTEENPWQIAGPEDLMAMQALCAAQESYRDDFYKLTADIDMAGQTGFAPIGGKAYATRFTGTLDGDGHSISNLTVSAPSHAALFGYLSGTVRDLDIIGATITSEGHFAAAVGANMYKATVEGVRVDASTTVMAGGHMAGAIAGLVRSATISSCASHADISASQAAGGIAGAINPISDNQSTLIINCTYEPVYQDGKISHACLATTNAVAYMGGIAGSATYNENLTGTAKTLTNSTIGIVNCYAYPLELASSQDASTTVYHIGGILGRADGAVTVQNCFSPITYSNILRSGTRVNASNFSSLTSIGGIIGRVYAAGATVTRTFSSTAFKRCYGNPGNVSVSHSLNTVKLGDPNMRGWGSTFLGETEYKQVEGGIAAALNAGATEWNGTTPAVEALEWAYDPTFGYPKPVGVDWPGTVTKKVSIIGDSISTYEGFMFAHDKYQQNKHYPNTSDIQDKYKPMVHNEQLTWWWRLIYGKMDNARLEADNAWGGSTVSYVDPIKPGMSTTPSAPHYQENSLQYRYQRYGLGNPDVLFSFGGRNDFGYVGGNSNVLLGDFSDDSLQAAYDAPQELYDNYSQGTVAILKAAHDKNPQLKILLILTDLMNDDFEDAASAVTSFLTDKGFDIRFANLHKRGTTNSTNNDIGVNKEQGSHPNATGCENIANYIWEQYGSWLNE